MPVSGKDGTASLGGNVTSWSLTKTQNNPSYASSETSGFKKRVAGIRDITASFEGKTGGTIPDVGDEGTLTLTVKTGVTFVFGCVIASVSGEGDFDEGEITTYTAEAELQLDSSNTNPTEWGS